MNFPEGLLRFVRAHRDELTLSVYVEATPADPAARRNWRVRLRQEINALRATLAPAPADESDAFERCAAEVLARIPDGDVPPATSGWACFCAAGGDTLALALPDAIETTAHWGLGARVVPYLRVAIEDHALIVQVDREHARIARWRAGVLAPIASFETPAPHDVGPHMGDAPRPGFHDGTRGRTRTDEERRQRLEATERLLATVRDRLLGVVETDEPVLIGGGSAATAHLVRTLPAQLLERARVVPSLTMRMDGPAATPPIRAALVALAAAMRERRVLALREQAHVNGRAAVGLAPTSAAADLGAVAELIFSERAWRQHPDEIEDLVRRALCEGARISVTPADGIALNGEADDIIAGLRFPLPVSH